MNAEFVKGAEKLVYVNACLKKNEKALILSDLSTRDIGDLIEQVSLKTIREVRHEVLSNLKIHGDEPSVKIATLMIDSDVIFCLTSYSLAHTLARKRASERGCRFLSLPDYSWQVLSSPALRIDFRSQKIICDKLTALLTDGSEVKIENSSETKIRIDINGRTGNSASGICDSHGCLASPPDIEANIAPVEDKTYGTAVIDGSIPVPEIGVLKNTITLNIEGGKIIDIKGGKEADILKKLLDSVKDDKAYFLGELGIGLNPLAKICGRMLEDEGTMGTIHLGFGSNYTIGGENKVPFHIDTVIKEATLFIDDRLILKGGELCI